MKLEFVVRKIHSLAKKRGTFSLNREKALVGLYFKLRSCDLISFLKLLQTKGGGIAFACATRCHFPILNGDLSERNHGLGEAAVLRDIFTIIHDLFPASNCPFLAEKRL